MRMITAYHRPQSIEEALGLLARPSPKTVPLGGGTLLSHGQTESIEVVDLQALGLDRIERHGNDLEIGATVTLQRLLEEESCPPALQRGLRQEAPLNLRNGATIAGTLVVCDGRSAFAAALLALDTMLNIPNANPQVVRIGDFLPVRPQLLQRKLITSVTIPLNVKIALDFVARTPADKPIVCVALAQWPSGRTRLAVGGYGPAPTLAIDGTQAQGLEIAARNAFHDASDPWGSADYRMDIAATLSRRCLALILQ